MNQPALVCKHQNNRHCCESPACRRDEYGLYHILYAVSIIVRQFSIFCHIRQAICKFDDFSTNIQTHDVSCVWLKGTSIHAFMHSPKFPSPKRIRDVSICSLCLVSRVFMHRQTGCQFDTALPCQFLEGGTKRVRRNSGTGATRIWLTREAKC